MKVLIVHAHPERQSFNAALTERAVATLATGGHQTQVSDLYAMGWDPVSDRRNFTTNADTTFYRQQREELHALEHEGFASDVKAEMDKLAWCDGLIFQFPLWWFGPPAILEGWVDRVFAMGVAYGRGRWCDQGYFAGKRALLSVTTGGIATAYSREGLNGDINKILYPINYGVLRFSGFDVLPPSITYALNYIDEDSRTAALDAYAQRLRTFWTDATLRYPSLSEFDKQTLQLKTDSPTLNTGI